MTFFAVSYSKPALIKEMHLSISSRARLSYTSRPISWLVPLHCALQGCERYEMGYFKLLESVNGLRGQNISFF